MRDRNKLPKNILKIINKAESEQAYWIEYAIDSDDLTIDDAYNLSEKALMIFYGLIADEIEKYNKNKDSETKIEYDKFGRIVIKSRKN